MTFSLIPSAWNPKIKTKLSALRQLLPLYLIQGISQDNYGETYVDGNKAVTYVHYLF